MTKKFHIWLRNSLILTLSAFFSILFTQMVSAGELNFHAVNIGRGDALIIESQNHYMIVDSGTTECADILLNYLSKLNIPQNKIDCIVATHPDGDHVGGFPKVLENYDVEHIYFSQCTKAAYFYYNFIEAAKAEGCPMEYPKEGQKWIVGDAVVQVIYDGTKGATYNECSIVLKVSCDGKTILLTGDMPTNIERSLLAQGYNFKADILKVGHHGAASSSCADFLDAVSPQYAVISCNPPELTPFPRESVLKRLARRFIKTYRTPDGDVVFNIKNGIISTKNKENNGYISIKNGIITLSNNVFFATGREIRPSVTLYVNGLRVDPSHYTVSYTYNVTTGVAKVKLSATEVKYVSKCSTTFLILPQKETLKYTSVKKTKIKLKWSAQSSATGYVIQYSTKKSFKKKKTITIKNPKTTKTIITNLKPGTKYYFRIRAYKSNVGNGKWSKTLKVKTAKKKVVKKSKSRTK